MKLSALTIALVGLASFSSSVSAATYAIAGFTTQNCVFSTVAYTTQQSGTDFKCHSFGKTLQGVAFNGDNFWCVSLYADGDCKNRVKYLRGGVSGCQAGSFEENIVFEGDHIGNDNDFGYEVSHSDSDSQGAASSESCVDDDFEPSPSDPAGESNLV
ncbi:hypothetical protein BX616_002356 [Lobosporangium transversale]|uniref:Uncharacterized protein n=1 Tax=Lobosporangium transversale TaxID=64571 RepID=A0A1Y2GWJ9_9FUNG|nr:hypothetical protein BCR41DRAFT_419657 [Lobosporangium transversale]KAF9901170.1 hypothetical protein BX616_002356 [Lobosporangium transversale]ORZ26676.1 hypothetical protein BCR41DRAFT_419657 [Lobosporangium transversale]|eukprot:XP_021884439.1 hypothetical protein BCR41DRAFT_419657 [Lobosporangium transversale]